MIQSSTHDDGSGPLTVLHLMSEMGQRACTRLMLSAFIVKRAVSCFDCTYQPKRFWKTLKTTALLWPETPCHTPTNTTGCLILERDGGPRLNRLKDLNGLQASYLSGNFLWFTSEGKGSWIHILELNVLRIPMLMTQFQWKSIWKGKWRLRPCLFSRIHRPWSDGCPLCILGCNIHLP